MPGNPNMKSGAPSVNPGGRSREQRSAARQQARRIQELTGNGNATAEFAFALLIAGGAPDPEDPDGDLVAQLAAKTLRKYGLHDKPITVEDKKWAAKYLDDRGLGKPEVSIDVTSDGHAVGTVTLLPIDLPAMTDAQLEDWQRQLRDKLAAGVDEPPG
jgi:hypothetical protein